MKKFGLLILTLGTAMALTACGGAKPETKPEATIEATQTPETTEAPEVATENFTGEKVGEVADEEGKTVATVAFENGAPVDVKFDYIGLDGSSKYQAAADGDYIMNPDGITWDKQMDELSAFLKENNFDINAVTYTDDAGHTDAVSGVSINVSPFVEALIMAMNS